MEIDNQKSSALTDKILSVELVVPVKRRDEKHKEELAQSKDVFYSFVGKDFFIVSEGNGRKEIDET